MPLPEAFVTIELTPNEQKSLTGTLAKAMFENPEWPCNCELEAVLDKIREARFSVAGATDV